MKRSTLSVVLLASVISFSAFADLTQQRAAYQKIGELLSISQSEPTRNLVRTLLEQIQDYPLYPYAQYQLLNANKDNLSLADIEAYQQANPTLPFANRLKKEWVRSLQEKQDWQTILANGANLPLDMGSQCILVQAKANSLPNIQDKTNPQTEEKSTALTPKLSQEDLTVLWLTGSSLPSQCDALLNQWHEQGGLTPELARQRAVMAFEQGNGSLLTHLQKRLKDEKNQNWVADLHALLTSPQKLTDKNSRFYIDIIPNKPLEKRILLAVFPAYVKTLTENQVKEPAKYFEKFEIWAKSFNLDNSQINDWKKLYLTQFFDSENAEFKTWRDQQLLNLKDEKLTERRIRMAIREQTPTSDWLNLLSEAARQKDEWQYWQAKNSDTEKSKQILTALSKTRGFYGMLAAHELGLPYKPTMETLRESVAEGQKTPVTAEREFVKPLARIAELRMLNHTAYMYSEWKSLMDAASFEQKLHLARYAEKQGWYDLSVEATIQAKAWNYVSLRLPNAYSDLFDLHLNGKKIRRTFAMAIARQESAWRPNAVSFANARGLMQLLPATAKLTATRTQLPYNNESQLFDPFNNIMLGTAHLQELQNKYGDNRILIAAAYNAGTDRVDKWLAKSNNRLSMAEFIASIPFFETRGYVQNVLAYDSYYQILQAQPQQLFSKEESDRLY
ncbi:lytic murein transglycosylase [Actinobacillus succinogenes]|uniref:Lytic transglycosylase catalytic n=1 Tax=Actinobacillus succinogenes (strain ATCC 55618 / DSM 22257 / CCUG 43843 / 130Z) TaxID=339671 RepID=A6VPL2_ACTSZ|nr:transglycosylase SLT domain-containing protein [Actinobacillus succinogenes]ABR74909.1 Lytic transglycosylase catalytic [Actinobacillus succinogenes 130Z]PHI40679.1 lytic murein transglycosylase [Actinobacillus succinogenes]